MNTDIRHAIVLLQYVKYRYYSGKIYLNPTWYKYSRRAEPTVINEESNYVFIINQSHFIWCLIFRYHRYQEDCEDDLYLKDN